MDEDQEDERYEEMTREDFEEERADQLRDELRADGYSYEEILKRTWQAADGTYLGPKHG